MCNDKFSFKELNDLFIAGRKSNISLTVICQHKHQGEFGYHTDELTCQQQIVDQLGTALKALFHDAFQYLRLN
jgi:hypothetical protein